MLRLPPLAATLLTFLLLSAAPLRAEEPSPADTLPPLTLAEAEERALSESPLLHEASLAEGMAHARLQQAGRPPNPAVALDAENLAGTGITRDTGAAEWTLSLSHTIPLGGKIRRRSAVAAADLALARLAREQRRLDVLARTRGAFHRAFIAGERVKLRAETLGLALRFAETVRRQVEAGKAAPVEAIRAGIEVSRARTNLARARREDTAARAALAASWGAPAPRFSRVAGSFPEPRDVPPWQHLVAALDRTPAVRRLAALHRRATAIWRRERARAVPAVEVRLGIRRFAETGDHAWVAGVGIPLPLFDRNRGGRRAARLARTATETSARAVRSDLLAGLRATRARLAAAEEELRSLREEVVPAATQAFRLVETGYREGKFGFLDVLDARRDLVDARELLLQAAEEVLLARVDLHRQTADALRTVPGDHP